MAGGVDHHQGFAGEAAQIDALLAAQGRQAAFQQRGAFTRLGGKAAEQQGQAEQ
ncbi:hypothetical protein D3C86_2080810 [compost metagenome]